MTPKSGAVLVKRFLNKAVILIGIILFVYTVMQSVVNNFNLGLVALGTIAVLLIVYGHLWRKDKIPKLMHIIVVILCLLLIAFAVFLASYGHRDNADYHEDVVLVLGAGIKGEQVSPLLQKRLDKAIEYHAKNPDAVIIVSGGKGPQEGITEALAMERYLTSQGIPAEQIIKEEKATSTLENFKFTIEILEKEMPEDFSIVFVTSDFHIYRAKMLSQQFGLSAGHISSPIAWHSVPVSYIREMMAVLQLWIFPQAA